MKQSLQVVREAFAGGRLTVNSLEDGSGVVLDVEGEQLMTMNRTGLAVVQLIADGADDMEMIIGNVVSTFEVSPARASHDTEEFIDRMAKVLQC